MAGNPISDIAKEFGLSPQTEMLEQPTKDNQLFIGVPRETSFQENRVALTPESVSLLVANGHRVVIETKAGLASSFKDQEYSEAGAQIAYDNEQVFAADIILKVAPLTRDELKLLKTNQTIFSPLHIPTLQKAYLQELMQKKVTAIAYEYIQDEGGTYPIVRAISEIAGSTSILIAAEYLSNSQKGPGVLLGGISGVPPTKVVVLGAGVVGEYVTRTALGLGADVRVFDNNNYKLMRLQNNIGRRVYTSVLNPKTLEQQLSTADVAVGAIHSGTGQSPCIVTEEMISNMKPGAIVIDVSIDQGGCFETSEITDHDNPVFTKYDVIHYCVPNIPSRVSQTASHAFSNVIAHMLLQGVKKGRGGIERILYHSKGARHGVYIYRGTITNQHLSKKFDLKFTDLDLLMAANF